MKNIRYTLLLATLAACVMLVKSCKNEDDVLALKRMFRPATITTTNGETQVKLSWSAALFTTSGEATYTVEVALDSQALATDAIDPQQLAFTTTTNDLSVTITDDKLAIKRNYYARIKVLGENGASDSKWMISSSFRITGEQYLLPVASADVIDRAVIVKWKVNPALTKIVFTPATGPVVEVTLDETDHAAGQKLVENLTAATQYTAEIFEGTKSKGTVTFVTKPGDATGGNVIDLRGITGKTSILLDTLPDIASGSVVILKRGQIYNIPSSYAFSKSATIISGLDFGTSLASITLNTNFNITAGSAIDSIVFKDIAFKGVRAGNASFDNDYIFNINAAGNVGKIRLENCTVKILRGVVRLQAAGAGAKVGNYYVNNCVIDSIREYGVATASSTSSFANISVTNSTIYKARRFIVGATGTNSVTVQNCTFNEIPSGGPAGAGTNYFIDFGSANNVASVAISNCIIGKTWEEGLGQDVQGFRAGSSTLALVTNCFSTSDFISTTNQLSGLSPYSGSSTAIFTDPSNGNFKIKDSNFPGKSFGDPRWK